MSNVCVYIYKHSIRIYLFVRVCVYRLTGFVIPLLFCWAAAASAAAALCQGKQRRLRCLPFTCYFLGLFLTSSGQRSGSKSEEQIVSFSCSIQFVSFFHSYFIFCCFLMFCQQRKKKTSKNER